MSLPCSYSLIKSPNQRNFGVNLTTITQLCTQYLTQALPTLWTPYWLCPNPSSSHLQNVAYFTGIGQSIPSTKPRGNSKSLDIKILPRTTPTFCSGQMKTTSAGIKIILTNRWIGIINSRILISRDSCKEIMIANIFKVLQQSQIPPKSSTTSTTPIPSSNKRGWNSGSSTT